MSSADTGDSTKCCVKRTSSGGGDSVAGATGRGSLFNAAFACAFVLWNVSVYSYDERNSDQR